MVKKSKFKMGDLVVQEYPEFNDIYFMIGRVIGIDYVDELSDLWLEGYDEEPYYMYDVEIVYIKNCTDEYLYLDLGDEICFEENEVIPLSEYFSRNLTVQDYIDYKYNNKGFI